MPDFALYPDARLNQAAVPRPVDDALRATGTALLAAVTEVSAYGLAAAHIGQVEPLVVLSAAGDRSTRDYRTLFNPVVTAVSTEVESGPEGSVSLPSIEVPVERARWAEIAYDDEAGTRQTIRLEGFAARVAQHEIDQMNGVFFLARVSRLKRDTALRKYAKSQRAG